ncbi:hypothetical protein R3W88_009677 [Solanum pinnatisectum]|uniref:Uncharacterized protein n=1 Tax=Solanum pinnatisectum TaxID=50273 RepID=A0AAV9MBE9_9SOLN|nr:hypothetical protein R3W88_009677 [Solanum pinnatisectum]
MDSRNINNAAKKPDRKTQEKNRRINMKCLFSKLFALIPPHHFSKVLKRRKDDTTSCSIKTPMVEVRELDSALEVILVSGYIIIEEEGAQAVSANYSTIDDMIFYMIRAQVKITRLGVDASRVNLRLQKVVS